MMMMQQQQYHHHHHHHQLTMTHQHHGEQQSYNTKESVKYYAPSPTPPHSPDRNTLYHADPVSMYNSHVRVRHDSRTPDPTYAVASAGSDDASDDASDDDDDDDDNDDDRGCSVPVPSSSSHGGSIGGMALLAAVAAATFAN